MEDQVIELNGHPTWVRDGGGDGPTMLLLHGGMVGARRTSARLLGSLITAFLANPEQSRSMPSLRT